MTIRLRDMLLRASFCSFVVVVVCVAASAPASADATPPPSTSVATTIAVRHKESMALLQAPLRPRVQAAARTLLDRLAAPLPPKAKPRDVLATAQQVVVDQSYLGLATRQPANIDTAVLLVLMEASQENERELARVRSERVAIAAIKGCKGETKCLSRLGPTAPMTAAEFDSLRTKSQTKADALDELGAQEMLLLQQMMEKKAQLETMISNVMKAASEGGAAAVAALKAS